MPPPPPPPPNALVTSTNVMPVGVELGTTDVCTAGNAAVVRPSAIPATAKPRLRPRAPITFSYTTCLVLRCDFSDNTVRPIRSRTEAGNRNAHGLHGCQADARNRLAGMRHMHPRLQPPARAANC